MPRAPETSQHRRRLSRLAGAAALGAAALAGLGAWLTGPTPSAGASPEVLALGRTLYDEHCAACHGADLEGQPDWQAPLPSGRMPAPPHDASGHTWHHSDAVLSRIVREGTAAVVGGGYESDMPGFSGVLDDGAIAAILSYIKSTWPERERAYQREVSRGG